MNLPPLIDSKLEVEGRTAILTFDRDEVGNSFVGTALAADVLRVLDWAEGEGEISVLVLTGRGYSFSEEVLVGQGGSTGSFIVRLASGSQEKIRSDIGKMISAMGRTAIPIIAAVNGAATGIGFNLCCLCDIRIGSSRAVLGSPICDYEETAGTTGVRGLQRLVGHQRAMEMVLSGRGVRADEALAIGLLFDVIEAESQLLPTVKQFAAHLSSRPLRYLRDAKRLMNGIEEHHPPIFFEPAAKEGSPKDRRLMEV